MVVSSVVSLCAVTGECVERAESGSAHGRGAGLKFPRSQPITGNPHIETTNQTWNCNFQPRSINNLKKVLSSLSYGNATILNYVAFTRFYPIEKYADATFQPFFVPGINGQICKSSSNSLYFPSM